HHGGAQRHQRQVGRALARTRRQARAEGDANDEGGQAQRHHVLVAADVILHQRRQQRQRHRSHQPEPGDDVRAAPQAWLALQFVQQRHGGGPRVGGDGQAGRRGAGGRNRPREAPGNDRQRQDDGDDRLRRRGVLDGDAAGDGAGQDGEEGGTLHQGIAGRQLRRLELLGQHAVFHRAEQRGDDAEQGERDEQDGHRVQEEADGGEAGDRDFRELDGGGDGGLVVAVGQLPAQGRQDEERDDEDDPG